MQKQLSSDCRRCGCVQGLSEVGFASSDLRIVIIPAGYTLANGMGKIAVVAIAVVGAFGAFGDAAELTQLVEAVIGHESTGIEGVFG